MFAMENIQFCNQGSNCVDGNRINKRFCKQPVNQLQGLVNKLSKMQTYNFETSHTGSNTETPRYHEAVLLNLWTVAQFSSGPRS